MTVYGITWSKRKHIVGHRNQHSVPFAACNANINLYVKGEPTMPQWLCDKWDTAPMCKRCAKNAEAS